jgi:hypothetical protein
MIASANRIDSRNGHTPGRRTPPLDAVGDGSNAEAVNGHDKAGHDKAGKFVPGNKCGRGNPHARRQADLRNALFSAMTPERMAELGEKLYSASIAGDWVAAKLLLSHCIGKPAEAVDADRLDLEEWDIVAKSPTLAQFLRALADSCDPTDAASQVREKLPKGNLNDHIAQHVKVEAERGSKEWVAQLNKDVVAEREARVGG